MVPGHRSNYQERILSHIYFSAVIETAAWGAELATALAED
jgi:rifampin ADP-ribosylating transferase